MKTDQQVEGAIPGVPVGSTFPSRESLRQAGIHNRRIHGIQGQQDYGCQSIVLNGGYETDEDYGDRIWYTGAGGQENRVQVSDQSLDHSNNLALLRSIERQNPIRVTRGPKADAKFRPPGKVFRYDGLFRAVDVEETQDSRGFVVYRFLLTALADTPVDSEPEPNKQALPARTASLVNHFQRKASLARKVKQLYEYKCQICGVELMTSGGRIAEAAHILALSLGGSDDLSNLLCLCPNHHSLFDGGGIWIDDEYGVRNFSGRRVGQLYVDDRHSIEVTLLGQHRDAHFPLP